MVRSLFALMSIRELEEAPRGDYTADFSVIDPYRMMRTDVPPKSLLERLCMYDVRGSIATQPAVCFLDDAFEGIHRPGFYPLIASAA